ncbi:methyltransferase domain-containing protein [Croceibacterium mercuriale]|uniref:methyltransferase domain-containing protein n=1 Tax=Croceibacterium mercuriale TaxID=1572751 RepID=UPI000B02792E|nr:methyltransferase domain-containing protein [Croceibacterium mercuriale]
MARLRGAKTVPPGLVHMGDLRSLEPLSREYGFDRGDPIDRYYIEAFLQSQSALIAGRVLEVGERLYTEKFGQGVTQSDMLHIDDHPDATYVDDLTDGETIPDDTYDCVILTQTLHLIFDMKAAVRTLFRVLKPGGVLLCTVPGITQIADSDWNDTWYWSLSKGAATKLFGQAFGPEHVQVVQYGNVLSATAFLHGMATQELQRHELDHADHEYPVIIAIAARAGEPAMKMRMTDRWNYAGKPATPYDDETSYGKGMAWLDGHGATIEDWGCGTCYAQRFVTQSRYVGVDGSDSEQAHIKAELQEYRSDVDCIFMRHVLEHNWGWRQILDNALQSFGKRMVLVTFTPFAPPGARGDDVLDSYGPIPDLALDRDELRQKLGALLVREEQIETRTQYGTETLFYLEK